jgi:hypothetical protein
MINDIRPNNVVPSVVPTCLSPFLLVKISFSTSALYVDSLEMTSDLASVQLVAMFNISHLELSATPGKKISSGSRTLDPLVVLVSPASSNDRIQQSKHNSSSSIFRQWKSRASEGGAVHDV